MTVGWTAVSLVSLIWRLIDIAGESVFCQQYSANNCYQSSLLKTMKPRLPRPKATWLLWLSHQLEWGCPLTTLRKITMFLKEWDGKNPIIASNIDRFYIHMTKQTWLVLSLRSIVPGLRRFEDSLDLTPSVLTHPSISTSLVSVDGNGLGGSIAMAGRAHPVIFILQNKRN